MVPTSTQEILLGHDKVRFLVEVDQMKLVRVSFELVVGFHHSSVFAQSDVGEHCEGDDGGNETQAQKDSEP